MLIDSAASQTSKDKMDLVGPSIPARLKKDCITPMSEPLAYQPKSSNCFYIGDFFGSKYCDQLSCVYPMGTE